MSPYLIFIFFFSIFFSENDDQEAFEFVKQCLKQLYEKPNIIFLTTISDLYAEKLKDNQAEDFRISYLKKNLRRKLMAHFTGFNDTEVNRHYPETLEIENLIHKHVQLQKEFDADIKCNEEENVLLKSVEILQKVVTTIQNERPWPPQASHLTVESFNISDRLNSLLQKLLSGKYTDIDSLRVYRLKLSFSQDLIYAMTHGKIKTPKSILFRYAIKSLTNDIELITITQKYGILNILFFN